MGAELSRTRLPVRQPGPSPDDGLGSYLGFRAHDQWLEALKAIEMESAPGSFLGNQLIMSPPVLPAAL